MENWEQEARHLRKDWESPDLWPRIAASLEAEQRRPRGVRPWVLALAAALVIALGASLVWNARHEAAPPAASPALLTEKALAEVQASEAAYVTSIDKLSKLAEPVIEMPPSPLVAAYAQKLVLLDGAIAELRAQADGNPLYGQVQMQLAALYRDKQATLQEVLRNAE